MKTLAALSTAALLLAALPVAAQEAAKPPEPKLELQLSGFYEFNGYTQNNFFLGRNPAGPVSDKDEYMIQLFRFTPVLSYGPNLKGVLSIDVAQGIWGVDNEYRDNFRPGFSNLYNNKDTNFLIHVDTAYVEFSAPQLRGTAVRLGRMRNDLGNRLVLDQDGDGIQIQRSFGGWTAVFDWTKMFEGTDGLTDRNFNGNPDGRDANLLYLDLKGKSGAFALNPFLIYYKDSGIADGRSYIPNELQYFNARFRPNITQATVLGFAWDGKLGKVAFKGEVDLLTGKDDIANPNSGPNQLLDVNNGDLRGHNLYLDFKLPVGKSTVGAVFGLGSGDDDLMSGKGNINKIRTNGFFYITEIWEDSIMPDEQGITPQGLGSPASRGYREFENTTLLQLNATFPLNAEWKLFASGTLVRATEALRPWADRNGNGAIDPGEFGSDSSRDLGKEIDLRLDWTIMKNLVWTLRGGIFFPGDAAGYLINGTNAYAKDAWEVRTTLRFNFGGLKLM